MIKSIANYCVPMLVFLCGCGVERQEAAHPGPLVVEIRLGGGDTVPLPVPFMGSLLDVPSLRDVIHTLDDAREDPQTVGVLLRTDGAMLSRADIQELSTEIGKLRATEKTVVVHAESLSNGEYLLATRADKTLLVPTGSLDLFGISADVMFFKELFDKIGVRADFERVGNFKSAVEPYTQTSMSPESEAQMNRLMDSLFGQMITDIAKNRKIPTKRAEELIHRGPYTAREALQVGLVDKLLYEDEVDDYLDGLLTQDVEILREEETRESADYTGFGGFLRFWMLASGEHRRVRSTRDKIALIHIEGMIVSGGIADPFQSGDYSASDTIVAALNDAASDETVKAIVLRVDSPGGSALASDVIWRAVEMASVEKPVVVSMGSVAASGGYYVSMGADRIVAERGTLTGSIGVFGGKFDLSGLYGKIGVRKQVLRRGRNATLYEETTGFSPTERERLRAQIEQIYEDFIEKAAKGRGKTVAQIDALAQGQVWTGEEAVAHGLVDEIGGLKRAFEVAKTEAGYSTDTKFELLELPEPPSVFDVFFRDGNSRLRLRLPTAADMVTAQAGWFQRLAQERILALLPFTLQLR